MSSTNPLEKVCGDLNELMLQHFNKSDVLKASEVSPEWNEAISKSAKCMAQIHLKFARTVQVPKVIVESKRQYNDLNIWSQYDQYEALRWEKIPLMVKLSPFLKKLEICHKSHIEFEPQNVQLPKLESLVIESDVPIALVDATKLKSLSLCLDGYNRKTIDWIESQEKLEELKLTLNGANFLDFDPKAPKGIKRFECWFMVDLTDADAVKFNNFMEPMCEALTDLKLEFEDSIQPAIIELVVNKMPNLKTVDFSYAELENLNKLKLKSNTSITELKIHEFDSETRHLLRSLVNLKHLTIEDKIIAADFSWISRNLMKLKKLSCCCFEKGKMVQRYKMKASKSGINKRIEIVFNVVEDDDSDSSFYW
jgi:hypothetical protein